MHISVGTRGFIALGVSSLSVIELFMGAMLLDSRGARQFGNMMRDAQFAGLCV